MRFVNASLVFLAVAFAVFALGIGLFLGRFVFQSSGFFFIVVSFVVASLFFLASLFFPKIIKINLVLTLALLGVAIYMAELNQNFNFLASTITSVPFAEDFYDTRSKRDVVDDLRRKGHDAYPNIFPRALFKFTKNGGSSVFEKNGFEFLPLAGISRVPTVFCNETGKRLVYESDEHGFHNPPGLWSSNQFDIMIVGDSFANGACVGSAENFVARIRKAFPHTVSIGMASNGPLLMLASIREFVPQTQPKVVIWFYFEGNDVGTDLPIERRMSLLHRYMEKGFTQNLIHRQPEIDESLRKWAARTKRTGREFEKSSPRKKKIAKFDIKGTLLLRKLRNKFNIGLGPRNDGVEFFKKTLANAKRAVEDAGGRFYFVYLPGLRRYQSFVGRLFQNLTRDRIMTVVKEELKIPMIDGVKVFARHPDPKSLFINHYTVEGNALIGDAVIGALRGALQTRP